jgi:hypothetical protein
VALPILSYAEAREYIETGDIACFRAGPRDYIAQAIARAESIDLHEEVHEAHVGYLVWPCPTVLSIIEAWEPVSRCVEFSSRIEEASGYVDVYGLTDEARALVSLDAVTEAGWRATNVNYPENHLLEAAWHILMPQWFPAPEPVPNSNDPKSPRVCSELIQWMFAVGGLPRMVPLDSQCWPAHFPLATRWWKGKFTLTFP